MAESFERARSLILDKVSFLPIESVGLLDLGGRVIAKNISAPCEMPGWDNSAMDGFAVREEDSLVGARLIVTGYIPAGGSAADLQVGPGTAIKIMTGAPIPTGCHAIVPIEELQEFGGAIVIKKPFSTGDHIRYRGEDVRRGDLVISARTHLRPAEISMLASFGLTEVKVFQRPRVAILSTGDELVEPGQVVGPGQITNSNAYSLATAVKEAGGEPVLLGIAKDNKEGLASKLREGLMADVLITSAGVSMGDRDFVSEVLQQLGVEQLFCKVDIKPGRPTTFGVRQGKPIFSLPGNPVSALVTFEELVRPALLKMQGFTKVIKPFIKARIQETVMKKSGRVQFLRVSVTPNGDSLSATSSGDQNTGILRTMLRANGIAVLAADRSKINAGEEIDVHLLSSLDGIPEGVF